MATIDGIQFNMRSMNVITKHRNVYVPSFDSVMNTVVDTGYDGLDLRLIGFENTRSVYDTVLAAFMAPGEHSLIVDEGWEYRIHSVVLNQSLPTYIVNNHFPYTLTMRTITPYMYSLDSDHFAKTITANNESWSQADAMPTTLLTNNDFEIWSNGVTSPPDHWLLGGTSASVMQTAMAKHGSFGARLENVVGQEAYIQYNFHPDYKGKTFHVGAWVWCNVPDTASIRLHDMSSSSLAYHSGSATWEWLEITKTVDKPWQDNYYLLRCTVVSSTHARFAYFDCVVFSEDKVNHDNFDADLTSNGKTASPLSIKIISSNEPSTEQAAIEQLEGY